MLAMRRNPRRGFWVGASNKAPIHWELTVATTDVDQTYTIDIYSGNGPLILMDWGDGTTETHTTTGQKTHTYAAAGTYSVLLSGLFVSNGNIRLGSNAGNASRLKATKVIPYIPGLISFQNTFYNCSGLSGSIPADLFRYNTQVSTSGFYNTFYNCSGLSGSIPADLFRYNTQVSTSGFTSTFRGCAGLTDAIPADLFRYNTQVSTNGFNGTFTSCTGLTGAIPADLFRYNTQVSTNGFNGTFAGCTNLSGSIPADLFRYNTQVSVTGFTNTFNGCINLSGSIPTDLFRYNTQVSTDGFVGTFRSCAGLTSAPSLLFAYCLNCNSFSYVMRGCNKLQLPADLFSAEGDKATRFLNKTVNFSSAIHFDTFTGTQGTAPDLWNYSFGTGTPTKTLCFAGHTSSSVNNFADIPSEWKT